MQIISRILSTILHPLLMPMYGMLLIFNFSVLNLFPEQFKTIIVTSVFIFTGLIPALSIFILYKIKRITHYSLNVRSERPLPYAICALSYIACGIVLYRVNMPSWVIAYTAGGLCSLLFAAVINIWWKISAHLTGIGGILATAVVLNQLGSAPSVLFICLLILLTGALGTARIYLGRHTLGQVLAGTLNGFLFIYLLMMLSWKLLLP